MNQIQCGNGPEYEQSPSAYVITYEGMYVGVQR